MENQTNIDDEEDPTPRNRLTEDEKTLLYKPGSIRRIKLKNFLTYSGKFVFKNSCHVATTKLAYS